MLTTKKDGPEGFPWTVCQEDGGRVAACPDESTAERVAFLLGSWKGGAAAPRVLVEAGKRVPPAAAPGAWAGHDRPQPGRVYELSGLAGGGVARDVTEEARRPVAVVRAPEAAAIVDPSGALERAGLVRRESPPAGEARGVPAAPRAPVPGGFPDVETAERAARAVVPGDSWSAGEARVWKREAGGFAVAFPRRPALHVRTELKAGGFRWDPVAGEWRGVRLPARFLPAVRS